MLILFVVICFMSPSKKQQQDTPFYSEQSQPPAQFMVVDWTAWGNAGNTHSQRSPEPLVPLLPSRGCQAKTALL